MLIDLEIGSSKYIMLNYFHSVYIQINFPLLSIIPLPIETIIIHVFQNASSRKAMKKMPRAKVVYN